MPLIRACLSCRDLALGAWRIEALLDEMLRLTYGCCSVAACHLDRQNVVCEAVCCGHPLADPTL